MFPSLFESTSIPVLEQVVNFSQARQNVLAGNIANVDTPGYKTRDLSVDDFQNRLKSAIDSREAPGTARGADPVAHVAKNSRLLTRHDECNVGPEQQVSEMVKNQIQHNTALTIMISQMRLLQAAIRGEA